MNHQELFNCSATVWTEVAIAIQQTSTNIHKQMNCKLKHLKHEMRPFCVCPASTPFLSPRIGSQMVHLGAVQKRHHGHHILSLCTEWSLWKMWKAVLFHLDILYRLVLERVVRSWKASHPVDDHLGFPWFRGCQNEKGIERAFQILSKWDCERFSERLSERGFMALPKNIGRSALSMFLSDTWRDKSVQASWPRRNLLGCFQRNFRCILCCSALLHGLCWVRGSQPNKEFLEVTAGQTATAANIRAPWRRSTNP